MNLYPNSANLREYNHCHGQGGKFSGHCGVGGTGSYVDQVLSRMGVPSKVAQTAEDIKAHAWVREEVEHALDLAQAAAAADAEIEKYGHGLSGTQGIYKDKATGKYTDAREVVHERIMDFLLTHELQGDKYVPRTSPLERSMNPVAIFMGGMTAAGKSTIAKDLNKHNKLYINADDIKALLPEWNGGTNAAALHEESGDIADKLQDVATVRGFSIILDATMKTKGADGDGGVSGKIDRLKKSGYRVEARFADVTVNTSLKRAIGRYLGELREKGVGRFVPMNYIKKNFHLQYGTLPRKTFEEIKHKLDAYTLVDMNDIKKPHKIDSHGKLTEVGVDRTSLPLGPAEMAYERADQPKSAKDRAADLDHALRYIAKRFKSGIFKN